MQAADENTANNSIPETEPITEPKLTSGERLSLLYTSGFSVAFLIVALLTTSWNFLILHTIAVGSLGGLVHEFAQSQGKIFFFRKEKDGLYLGSLTGMILGTVAGLLVIRSYIQPPISGEPPSNAAATEQATQNHQPFGLALSLEIFFAALGLKGVAEAATGQLPED
jgi:hypothetical protein